ncbi:MAG: hypothetical protein JWO05_970 [Gemmatimonadetes bacterium]|nr:hypothetical protein [Gemmatimonadota bacterium]
MSTGTSRKSGWVHSAKQLALAIVLGFLLFVALGQCMVTGSRANMTSRGVPHWNSADAEAHGRLMQRVPLAPGLVPVGKRKLRVLEAWVEMAHEDRQSWFFWLSEVQSDHAVLAFRVDALSARPIRIEYQLAEGGLLRYWSQHGTGDSLLYFRTIEGAVPDSLRLVACYDSVQRARYPDTTPRELPDCPPHDEPEP